MPTSSVSKPFFLVAGATSIWGAQVERHLVELANLVDQLEDALFRLGLVEHGVLVLVLGVTNEILHADLLAAQLVAEIDDLADGDRAVEDGGQHAVLAVFDALGDLDLALAGEQRDGAHLAEVHPDRVVRLRVVARVFFVLAVAADGVGLLGFDVFFDEALRGDLDLGGAVDDLDVLVVEGAHHVVHLVDRGALARHRVGGFVVGEKVALLVAAVLAVLAAAGAVATLGAFDPQAVVRLAIGHGLAGRARTFGLGAGGLAVHRLGHRLGRHCLRGRCGMAIGLGGTIGLGCFLRCTRFLGKRCSVPVTSVLRRHPDNLFVRAPRRVGCVAVSCD